MKRSQWLNRTWVMVCCVLWVVGAAASDEASYPAAPVAGSAEFERVKQLVGKWEGTSSSQMHGEESARVEYRLTSGGSAVVEILFPGTPQEMVSVYTDRGGKLAMTHYCMLGNQPKLKLISSGEDRLELSLAADSDINTVAEPHMHALTLSFDGPDQITQRWAFFEGGQEKDTTTLTLTRIQ